MAGDKTDIFVYAHWVGMPEPRQIGILSAHRARGKQTFSFSYDRNWLHSEAQRLLDPDIGWYEGAQFPQDKPNFGVFLDSMPDTWGKTLMRRHEAQRARQEKRRPRTLLDMDFLLGVYDQSRMGALRFKTDPQGPFLDDSRAFPTPPWSSIRELQYGAAQLESDRETVEVQRWLSVLMAPGSSLGGARPKANILDDTGHPWIAKFPSRNDTVDKAAWEYLAYLLAIDAGINMAPSRLEHVAGQHRTFFTKRFDRMGQERIHFASAMTMTGHNEPNIRDQAPSYLEIVDFIQYSGARVKDDLHQLWRRIVFNIAISNTDDHLRNHGFTIGKKGWHLSPAYDINPSIEKEGLSLNIDLHDNAQDFDLAREVGVYFRLSDAEMDTVLKEVGVAVRKWRKKAQQLGISRAEIELMAAAFQPPA